MVAVRLQVRPQWVKDLALLQAVVQVADATWTQLWLWLWCRPEAAAPIGPLDWELPYAAGTTIKRKKKFERFISK